MREIILWENTNNHVSSVDSLYYKIKKKNRQKSLSVNPIFVLNRALLCSKLTPSENCICHYKDKNSDID